MTSTPPSPETTSNDTASLDAIPNTDPPSIRTINDPQALLRRGICIAPIPPTIPLQHWADHLTRITPLNLSHEGDNEYAFYQNILEEPDFPFRDILNSEIGTRIKHHFDIRGELTGELRLDDAFCVHYNTKHEDTSGSRHVDPSDITVNMCLESLDVEGSEVKFYGSKVISGCGCEEEGGGDDEDDDGDFLVEQRQGHATIHWGGHPHETMALRKGRRTNIVLTYWFTDEERSEAAMRTCYA